MIIKTLANEKFYGGQIAEGSKMPFKIGYKATLHTSYGNQVNYLLLSNKGRYIYSDFPFDFEVNKDSISLKNNKDVITGFFGDCLRSAYLYSMKTFYKSDVENIEAELYRVPQFNTWIELIYNQNQEGILNYAESIIDNGFNPGVLMIDDNWQEDYGVWKFNRERFSSPKEMTKKLHDMGFKIMLWLCPFVSPDSAVFRFLNEKSYLIKTKDDKPYLIEWWNGWSAVLDLSNPGTVQWFKSELDKLQKEYDIDGFKFDAGAPQYYPKDCVYYEKDCYGFKQTQRFSEFASLYPFSELRETCNQPQGAAAQRLRDKNHSWVDNGVNCLIPDSIAQSLMGYQFICPDMIGGGEFQNFTENSDNLDTELIIRSAQASALLPMMQFSAAPWRILNKEELNIVKKAADIHNKFSSYIIETEKKALKTREAVVRSLEYSYPHKGYENINDEFLLGEKLLVCPVLAKGVKEKEIVLPDGNWVSDEGKEYEGNCKITVKTPLERLVYFELKN